MDSDESLFERLLAGDMAAFDRLYERYERPLFGFVRLRVGDAEAEDILHEAFMAVLRERERRSEVRSFRAWLYQVANNLCRNRSRSQKRAAAARVDVADVAEPGADAALDAHQRTERLRRAVARLPQPLAEVYRLRAAGMSYDELATALDVPLGTVKSRMHEMVKWLREEIAR